jgi:hypothetical protein
LLSNVVEIEGGSGHAGRQLEGGRNPAALIGAAGRHAEKGEAVEVPLPGPHLRWLVNGGGLPAADPSMCAIRVSPDETVRPAHSHPDGGEIFYILSRKGREMVEGVVDRVGPGTVAPFPQAAVYML